MPTNWLDIAKYSIRSRPDFSISVTHWTKGKGGRSAFDILKKIISEKKIVGSSKSGFIKGSTPAVCFSEAPVTSMFRAFIAAEYDGDAKRYLKWDAYGLSFYKPYLFRHSGRPALYLTDEECSSIFPQGGILAANNLWRVVKFDHSNLDEVVDFTHEREWRLPGDLEFNALEVEERPLAIVKTAQEAIEIRQQFLESEDCVLRGVLSLHDLRSLG